ncbi:MAG: hypothetical protein P0S94_05150, partial [Simkaniaceae bacterium]|nr:hypothetical protein [Simkaniaceae bacterium]
YVSSFLECVLLSLFLGRMLDAQAGSWPWLFAGFSFISLTSLIGMYRIPMKTPQSFKPVVPSFEQNFLQPWKESYALTKQHPHFAHFQWSFMIGGFGLMLMFPAFAIYVSDVLKVSYNSLSLARCMWMAVGVTLSSPIWRLAIKHLPTHKLTSIVCIGFSFYPIALLIAQVEISWFYLAFLLYGIAQAGSHLLWHLSGTLFAGDQENSSKFTTVNILTVGLRGLIAPALGGVICKFFGPTTNMVIGSGLCLVGGWYMLSVEKKVVKQA